MRRVLVVGASGHTGTALLGELSRNGLAPVAALRPQRIAELMPGSCESRPFAYGSADLAASVLNGVDGLFLMVPFHEEMVAWGEQLVSHAQRQGVSFVVRLSAWAAAPDCASAMGALHGRIDRCLQESGLPHTILRCNSFMQNFTGLYRSMILRHRMISLPEAHAQSCFIDTADIAAVAGRIFSDPQNHAGRVYDLTGPESLGNAEVAAIISSVSGEQIAYRPASDEATVRSYRKLGLSEWRIEVLMSLSRFIAQGGASRVSRDVDRILGRSPLGFRQFADSHRHCWELLPG